MNHCTKALIIFALFSPNLGAENNNLIIAGTAAVLGGVAGGILGYYAKATPPHTLDALHKRAEIACKKIEGIESADPLTLMASNGQKAIEYMSAFDTDAEAIVRESFEPRLVASLKGEDGVSLDLLRTKLLEKQRIIREKQAQSKAIAPHVMLIRALQDTPPVPADQVGSRLACVERIKEEIDMLSLQLQKSRATVGSDKMGNVYTAAEQRIKNLSTQRSTLEKSTEYAKELADLRAKTAYEQAQAKRIQEERTTKEMLDSFQESQRKLEKAERLAAEANAKQAAAAALTLSAQSKISRAEDREQAARSELAHEQLKTSKLLLALQQAESKTAEHAQKLQSAQQEIAHLRNRPESAYYTYYVSKQAEQRADAAKAFTLLEQEIKSPSMNPENHQEWRKVLEKKIEAARQAAIPTCAICTDEIASDLFVAHCDHGDTKATHEYHGACIQQQKNSAAGKPITCALCRAKIANAASI